ncbi:MAG: GFA family protein [Phenylobacterium sp.]|nr:MAG: GFA family protein [Phenylobacterium sp.]
MRKPKPPVPEKRSAVQAEAACVCGAVRLEIDVPAVWAWHDHSEASRRAQGCAYATYVGSWKSRFRMLAGEERLTRFEDRKAGTVRSFCAACGTPVLYERARSPAIVNIPRALFASRTGREPRYHMNLTEKADWTWAGEPLGPLKGYPGVMWARPKRRREPLPDSLFSPEEA